MGKLVDDMVFHRPGFFLRRHSRLWVIPCALLLAGLVALVDYGPGQQLSCLLFYLIPVALAAWWGGFAPGVLLSLVAAALRFLVREAHGPPQAPAVAFWDGAVHFGFFTLSSSLLSRLRLALAREQALARTDPLTGAANGRTFYERVGTEVQRALRSSRPLTLAYLDVDGFKEVNDRLGHTAGDELLRQVAAVIRAETRANDLVARLGGDEFALLLPEVSEASGAAALTRVHEALLQGMALRGWPVTFSIGAGTFLQPAAEVDDLVGYVDDLMYRVKRGGKNRLLHEVVHGLGCPPPPEDRRGAVRLPCARPVRVRVAGGGGAEPWSGVVRDVSAHGIGLCLDVRLPEETLLIIEPFAGPGDKTVLARVVRTAGRDDRWLHGCRLATRLSVEELGQWTFEQRLPSAETIPDGGARCR
jgi:diguanylate cyclase (GGDEF)-like protein